MTRFLVGSIITFGTLIVASMIEGGNPLMLLFPSVFLVTFGMPFFAVLTVWGFKDLGAACADAFSHNPDAERRRRSARLWGFYEKASYLAGFIAFIAGCIIVLANLDRPFDKIGGSFSAGLTAPLCGACFGMLGHILKHRVSAKD
ncbi:MAG: hypothetical protein WCQ50_14280 [Spirochaetota bacterium]